MGLLRVRYAVFYGGKSGCTSSRARVPDLAAAARLSHSCDLAISHESPRTHPYTRAREPCDRRNRPKMVSCPSAPDDRGTRSPSRTQTALVISPIRPVTQPGPTRPNNVDKDAVLTSDTNVDHSRHHINNKLHFGRPEVRQRRRPDVRDRRRRAQPRTYGGVAQPRGPRRRLDDGLTDRTQFS